MNRGGGGGGDWIWEILDTRFGAIGHSEVLYSSWSPKPETPHPKPHAAEFSQALNKLGIAARYCLDEEPSIPKKVGFEAARKGRAGDERAFSNSTLNLSRYVML